MCTSQQYRCETWDNKIEFIRGASVERFNPILQKYKEVKPIPCGKCVECRMQHAQEWAFRCMKEAAEYQDNIMVTLTYNDENIPKKHLIDKETGEIKATTYTLKKKDMRNFLDKMRKHYGYESFRYYYAGEYGDQFGRPHYHIIFFGLKVKDMEFLKWSKCEWSKEKNALYRSRTIDKIWGKGFVDLNEVNYETCCYVARYVLKKYKRLKGTGKEDEEETGKLPEYTCMSRRPGIGHAFFEKNKEKFENEETFWQRTKKGLIQFKPGRYFDKQIEKENPELMEAIKKKREEKSQEHWQDILSKTDLTKEEYIANLVSKREQRQRFMKRTLI